MLAQEFQFNAIKPTKPNNLCVRSTIEREDAEVHLTTCCACSNAALTPDGLTRGTPHLVFWALGQFGCPLSLSNPDAVDTGSTDSRLGPTFFDIHAVFTSKDYTIRIKMS